MDAYENHQDTGREKMQGDDDLFMSERTEGIFSSNKCEPKKKEAAKEDKKKSGCGCKTASSSKKVAKRRKKKETRVHYNPFIVYYLKKYYENPSKKITETARVAAKEWCKMSDREREKYIKIARAESARRQRLCIKVKRRRKC